VLIMTTDSDYYRYLKQSAPAPAAGRLDGLAAR
jgi:hypothetical protein